MLPGLLVLLALPFIATWYAAVGTYKGGEWLVRWFLERRKQQQLAIERELDRKQAELRGTILNLADALGMEAHEARKALIRESYRVSGQPPQKFD